MLAKFFHKRVRIIAQGIGPLKSSLSKFLTYLAFKSASWVSVRDKTSSTLLKEWKIDHYYGSDLAWLLEPDDSKISAESLSKIQQIFFDLNKKLVVISLRTKKFQNDDGLIKKIISALPEDYNDTPVLILQMQDEDHKIHSRFCDFDLQIRGQKNCYFIDANKFSPEEIVYILKNYCYHLFGMRLHSLILARIAGLDITPIAFDQKINEFRDQIDLYPREKLKERAKKHFV